MPAIIVAVELGLLGLAGGVHAWRRWRRARGGSAVPGSVATVEAEVSITSAPAPCDAGKICSGDFLVAGQDFCTWFNTTMHGKPGFPNVVNSEGFRAAFDNVADLWAPSITLAQFVAFFCIFYNETGGTFRPVAEMGGPKYCFETKLPGGGTKQSYNKSPNRLCGNQLAARGAGGDVAAWNGQEWPGGAAAKAAEQCDFFKFRGRGLIQTTWRPTYLAQVDPLLKKLGLKSCDEMTTEELDEAVLKNPAVYLGMVKAFFSEPSMAEAFAKVDQSPPVWAPTGTRVSGSAGYGNGLYTQRCQSLYEAMKAAGTGAEKTSSSSSASKTPSGAPGTPAPSILRLRAQLDAMYPARSKASDGIMGDAAHQARASDHNDGTAIDFTHDPGNGPELDRLAEVLLSDRRTKYVIWNRRIAAPMISGGAWRPYTGSNPHTRHLHLSILAEARNDTADWPQTGAAVPASASTMVTTVPTSPASPATPYVGSLAEAWKAGLVDNVKWVTIDVGGYKVDVSADALSVAGVRLPGSFKEARSIAATAGSVLTTKAIDDARWKAATRKLTPDPMVGGPNGKPEQVLAFNRELGPISEGELVAGGWKTWILEPDIKPGEAVNYGLWKSDGTVWQPPGHKHGEDYGRKAGDYSQLVTLVRRRAVSPTGAVVDLVDELAKPTALGGPVPAWILAELRGA
jgi:hypothetical protein